ncbi:MAG: sulfite exporter TauE/SafE family protein [Candidatus Omnitrophota bacterium]
MSALSYALLGLTGGLLGGAFGIGGGALMVPALVFFFGLSQHQAQGTSLALMLPPVTLFAALRYYYAGHVNVKIAIFGALGFLLGAFISANFVQGIEDASLKRAFGIFLMMVGIKMVFFK